MKRNRNGYLCLAATVLATATLLNGQQSGAPAASGPTLTAGKLSDSTIQLMREDMRAERKKIVAANMTLTETEATGFWPVYDRYIAETIKVNDVRYALIKEYSQNYSTMNEDQADSFIKRWLALDQDNTELRHKFIPEFEKVISPKKTATFFQVDRRVAMMIELQIASQVPLLNPSR